MNDGGPSGDFPVVSALQPTLGGVGFLAAAVAAARRCWPLVAATLSTTFLADLLYTMLNPRIRQGVIK